MTFAELSSATDPDGATAIAEILTIAKELAPDATEGVSYGIAALIHQGKPLIGIGATAKDLTLFPFSGAIVSAVADQLSGFRMSKGAIGFTGARPVPAAVIRQVVSLRLDEIAKR